jgi:serpin B
MLAREIAAALVVVSIAGSGCAGQPAKTTAGEETTLVARGNNAFAIALYRQLEGNPGNLFFSPYSISTAMAMTYAGAKGSTQEQMAQTLWYPTSAQVLRKLGSAREPLTQEQFAEVYGQTVKGLNTQGAQNKYQLRVANALWGQRDYEFLPAFVTFVQRHYGGQLQKVDFITDMEEARQMINTWVEKQTSGKIKNLISQGVLDAATRLVLTNAIYFKGAWARQFKADHTRAEPFTLLGGDSVQVTMMNQEAEFGYAETDTLQALEMPYAGEGLSMVILSPKEPNGIGRLEAELTAENLNKWLGAIGTRDVIVTIPKFKMTSKFAMESVLRAMGMTEAFSKNADFSGMTGKRDLFISAVIHQAYVDVNEEGTEAAAATGVIMKLTSAGPEMTPIFRADHPFVFLIRDKASGSILFLGRVMNPQS